MTTDRFRLDGKRALVTGAGRGIGRTLARGLAEAGADVALLARTREQLDDAAREVEALGRRALVLVADMRDRASITAAFDEVGRAWGGVDVLVANAGINVRVAALDATPEEWDAVVRTNLDGAFACAQAAGRLMRAEGTRGSVVFIGSVGGHRALSTGAAYAASKGALEQLTRTLALEWGSLGIRVNLIAPWYFSTPLTAGLLSNPAFVKAVHRVTPMGRAGELEELIGPTIFLSSPAASYITGQVLSVDGGMSGFGFDARDLT